MKSDPLAKSLKNLERVKGIEPSYSAWKAAALPLSYTRATDQLSRRGSGLNRHEWICPLQTVVQAAFVPSLCFAAGGALNTG